jgi:hypothetical protein
MNTALKKQSLHLFIDVKIPEKTIASINKVYVQEAIRILLQSDLEALAGDSPEDILQGLGFSLPKNQSATKGKWARIMEEIEPNAMGEEAGKEFDKGRKEFRETFAIGDA